MKTDTLSEEESLIREIEKEPGAPEEARQLALFVLKARGIRMKEPRPKKRQPFRRPPGRRR